MTTSGWIFSLILNTEKSAQFYLIFLICATKSGFKVKPYFCALNFSLAAIASGKNRSKCEIYMKKKYNQDPEFCRIVIGLDIIFQKWNEISEKVFGVKFVVTTVIIWHN